LHILNYFKKVFMFKKHVHKVELYIFSKILSHFVD
jgi:hypothetical protein